jgi:DNA-directed RNA polymerase subunit RPC12/RpoP
MENKIYLKKVLSNETDFKKLWQLEKDVRLLDKKFGVGATSGLQLQIHDDRKQLEVEIHNKSQYWDREFGEMKRYNLSQYLKQFKKRDINYQDYRDELMDDLNKITDKIGKIGGYSLYGSTTERTTEDSDIPLFLINASNYEYAKNKAKEYANTRLMKTGGTVYSKYHLQLGDAMNLGITPKIKGHDMIAVCDYCGSKFSYENAKNDILWECPECKTKLRIDR